jgi:hypothetical protein
VLYLTAEKEASTVASSIKIHKLEHKARTSSIHMHFEYEITADEFVACQLLYYKLSGGRKRVERAAGWIVAGLALIFIAWHERFLDSAQIILTAIGAWWIYSGVASFFPARYFRRAYPSSGCAGKRFTADANEDGFEVMGDLYSWRVRWPGVRLKGENERVFMLYSQGTIFMFGKTYLNNEQQQELRRLSGLTPHSVASPAKSDSR